MSGVAASHGLAGLWLLAEAVLLVSGELGIDQLAWQEILPHAPSTSSGKELINDIFVGSLREPQL